MKPKLWDGANAVGEAKERHLQTVDTPYLTASAEGFMARKRGPFSEVSGEKPGTKLVLDGWFSISDASQEQVHIYASPDYRTNFKRRGTINQIEGGLNPGSVLSPDGRGRGTTVSLKSWEYDDPNYGATGYYYIFHYQQLRLALSARSYSLLCNFDVDVGGDAATAAGVALGSGAFRWLLSEGKKFVSVSYERYTDDREVVRTRAKLQWFAPDYSGQWTLLREGGLPGVEYEDSCFPWICWMSPTKIVAVLAHRPESMWSLHISEDSGVTWSPAVVLDDAFPGAEDLYGPPDWEPPSSEEDLHDEYPLETWEETRLRFILQPEIKERLWRTSRDSHLFATNETTCVISTPSYWQGEKRVLAISVVSIYPVVSVLRSHTFDAPELFESDPYTRNTQLLVLPIGKNAWVVDVYRYRNEWESEYEVPSIPMQRWATFDCGATYVEATHDESALMAHTWHVNVPFKDEESKYELLVLADRVDGDGTSRVLLKTENLTTFTEVATVAKPAHVLSRNDFSKVAHIGTPDKPGPITPHAPWTTDDTWAEPAWWAE